MASESQLADILRNAIATGAAVTPGFQREVRGLPKSSRVRQVFEDALADGTVTVGR